MRTTRRQTKICSSASTRFPLRQMHSSTTLVRERAFRLDAAMNVDDALLVAPFALPIVVAHATKLLQLQVKLRSLLRNDERRPTDGDDQSQSVKQQDLFKKR